MKRCSLAVVVAGLLFGAGIAQDAPKGNEERIQGTWKVIFLESRDSVKTGKKVPEEKIKGLKVVITKDKLVLRNGKELERAYYKLDKLDATKKPKWIDFTFVGQDPQNKTYEKPVLGIYEWDGDDLKLCIGDPSPTPKRPADFEVSKLGIVLMVLKRDKD